MAATNSEQSDRVPVDSADLLGDLLRAAKGAFITAAVFSFIINTAILVMPFYMYNLFRRVIPTESHETLWLLLMVVVWVLLIQNLIEYARSLLLEKISRSIDEKIGHRIFDLSVQRSVPRGAGSDMSLLSMLQSVRSFISSPTVFVAMDAPWVPLFIVVLFMMNFYIGLTALIVILIALGLAVGKRYATDALLAEGGRAAGKAGNLASMAVRNADTIEALGMSKRLIDQWRISNDKAIEQQAKASRRSGIFQAFVKFMRMGSMAAVMTVGMMQIFDPKSGMAPGSMMASMLLITRCIMPLELLTSSWDSLSGSIKSIKTLREFLKQGTGRWTEAITPEEPEGHLSVLDLLYDPPETTRVILNRVTFQLKPGESLAILGPTASGKSSLARLIVGIEQPSAGDVRLDDTMLHAWDADDRGKHIGYLPQHVQLMAGNVYENISRFSPDATEAEVWRAIDLAGAREVVEAFSEGLQTDVGEDGGFLSGGQKQRIGLARAVYGNVKLVVLDEPNANLDSAGDNALSEALVVLKQRGVTVVVILHRPNVLSVVDYIMVLKDGGIQKFAPRDEMLPLIGMVPQPPVEQAPPTEKVEAPDEPKRAEAIT
jgi:PrtD family type I secretion system ABC transporter